MRFHHLPASFVSLLLALTPTTTLSHTASHLQHPLTFPVAHSTDYQENLRRAESAYHVLQAQYYNPAKGLYNTTGWWNAANIITTIANLAIVNPALSPEIESILRNTYERAPESNPAGLGAGYEKIVDGETYLITTSWGESTEEDVGKRKKKGRSVSNGGWLNDYYDDEAWWALAWLRSYDLTQNTTYLNTSISIFTDLHHSLPTPCGGIWWNKAHTYVNAITNELFLAVAASLANRASSAGERKQYLDIAITQWKWFVTSGMINKEWNINDGLSRDCVNNRGTVWSYNQGVILEGLSELWIATSDDEYLVFAKEIATAALNKLTNKNEILSDVCERNGCGADGVQFKGVFLRGLMGLYRVLEEGEVKERVGEFVNRNAESVWRSDRDERGRIGVVWDGPLREVNAGSHGSGLDALVAGADLGSFR